MFIKATKDEIIPKSNFVIPLEIEENNFNLGIEWTITAEIKLNEDMALGKGNYITCIINTVLSCLSSPLYHHAIFSFVLPILKVPMRYFLLILITQFAMTNF